MRPCPRPCGATGPMAKKIGQALFFIEFIGGNRLIASHRCFRPNIYHYVEKAKALIAFALLIIS